MDTLTHPNLKVIHRVDNKSISVEHVRNSLDFLTQTTIEGAWKVLIIDSIGELNSHSQNALLKCLEEPRPRTLFLLVAQDGEKILPTICSRAIPLNFKGMQKSFLLEYGEKMHSSLPSLNLYVELASGSIGRLNLLIQHEGLLLYQKIIHYLLSGEKSSLGELASKYDPLFLIELVTLIYQRSLLKQTGQILSLVYEGEAHNLERLVKVLDWKAIGTLFTRFQAVKTLHLDPATLFIE